MCDPLTIASIALTAGSVVANSIAAGEQSRARDSVLAAERIRQNAFDLQSDALNKASQDNYVDFKPQQDQRAVALGDYLAADVAPDANTSAATVMPTSESDIVNQELSKKRGEAQGFVDQQGDALGELRAFGDLLGEKSLLQARDASKIAQVGGFKRGSNAVMPLELVEAAKAGDGWMLLGDLLSGAGGITSGMAIGGYNPFAKASVSNAAKAVGSGIARSSAMRGASLAAPNALLGG